MDLLKKFNLVPYNFKVNKPGDIYGRLTILAIGKNPITFEYYAVCQCSCGSEPKIIQIQSLKKGNTKSCGCLLKERIVNWCGNKKHGKSKHRLYPTWNSMLHRCYKEKHTAYKYYGGRGITVCQRWHDINNFIEDMYPSFKEGLQLDRIDNDKGYSPDNCRWVTPAKQARNSSKNIYLTHNGKTLCVKDWSRITGIHKNTLNYRIRKSNWSTEKALTTPSH